MEFDITSLGLDMGIILGIIFIGQFVKKFLSKCNIPTKHKKWFIFMPLGLSLLAALVATRPLAVQDFFKNLIVYTGASSYIYNGRKLFLKEEIKDETKTKEV